MRIDYDPEADALYIQLRQGEVDDTIQASQYIYVDVDENGLPLGIEILFARRLLIKEDLVSATLRINQLAPVG